MLRNSKFSHPEPIHSASAEEKKHCKFVSCAQVKGLAPGPDEDPFFCLLQNDQLITEVKVTTDRLLTPKADAEHVNEVQLVILVRTVFLGGGISGFIA